MLNTMRRQMLWLYLSVDLALCRRGDNELGNMNWATQLTS